MDGWLRDSNSNVPTSKPVNKETNEIREGIHPVFQLAKATKTKRIRTPINY